MPRTKFILAVVAILPVTVCSQQNRVSVSTSAADTSFVVSVGGNADFASTRRYSDESIFWYNPVSPSATGDFHKGVAGIENNVELMLANHSSQTILNPRIEINGRGFAYSFRDLANHVLAGRASSLDDTIRIVQSYLSSHMYHWPASSEYDSWLIKPLRNLNVFGTGMCDQSAKTAIAFLKAIGLGDAVQLDIANGAHSIPLLRRGGRSIPLDSDIKVLYPRLSSDSLADLEELLRDQHLVRRQHHYGAKSNLHQASDNISLLYSGRLNVREATGQEPDSLELRLRPNETFRFRYRARPLRYQFYHTYYTPIGAPPTAAEGIQEFSPLLDSIFASGLSDADGIAASVVGGIPSIHGDAADTSHHFFVPMENPYAILGAELYLRSSWADSTVRLRVLYREGPQREPVLVRELTGRAEGTHLDRIPLDSMVVPLGRPILNRFEIGLAWESDRPLAITIDSLTIMSPFQFNPDLVPHLSIGENEVRIRSSDGDRLEGFAYEHHWDEVDSIQSPPRIELPVYPGENAIVPTDPILFQWGPPAGWAKAAICDYHIQVSRHADFRFPLSSSYDVLVSQSSSGSAESWLSPPIQPLSPGRYYWRVSSRSAEGVNSPWSPVWSFSIAGPEAVRRGRVEYTSDGFRLAWDPGEVDSLSQSYLVLGGTERGFSPDDSLIRDVVRTPHYEFRTEQGKPVFPFYRVISVDALGNRSDVSDLLCIDSLRFWLRAQKYPTVGDTIAITVMSVEPVDRYSAGDGPGYSIDKLEIDQGALPLGFRFDGRTITGQIAGRADSMLSVRARTTLRPVEMVQSAKWKVNTPPVLTGDTRYVAREDSSFTFFVHASDADSTLYGDSVIVHKLSGPSWLDVDPVHCRVWGTPAAGDVGISTMLLRATDRFGGEATTTIEIEVLHTNHPPTIRGILSRAPDSSEISVSIVAFEDTLVRGSIVAHDRDSELFGDRLEYRLHDAPAWLGIDSLTGRLHGVPGATDVGDTVISVLVEDRAGEKVSQSFTLRVIHVNHPPRFITRPHTLLFEDAPFSYGFRATDADSLLFGDVLEYRLVRGPGWLKCDPGSGILKGIPGIHDLGDATFELEASDAKGGKAIQIETLKVQHLNHPPTIATEFLPYAAEDTLYMQAIRVVDTDTALGESFRFSVKTGPSWLHCERTTGVLSGSPGAGDVGAASLIIEVQDDSGAIAGRSFLLQVRHTNHAPIIVVPPDSTAREDVEYRSYTRATDPDSNLFGDQVRYRLVDAPGWLRIDSVSGVLQGTPRMSDLNPGQIRVRVSDGMGGSAECGVNLNVHHVNHPPRITTIPVVDAFEGSLYAYHAGAADVDSILHDSLRYGLIDAPGWLSIDERTGHLSGIPQAPDVGAATIHLEVRDRDGAGARQIYDLSIAHVNHPPAFLKRDTITATEDIALLDTVRAKDVDSPYFNDRVTFSKLIGPGWMELDSASGGLSGTPSGYDIPAVEARFLAVDAKGGSDTLSLLVVVQPVNHAPKFMNLPDSVAREDSLFVFRPQTMDVDAVPKSDSLTFACTPLPSWLTFDARTGMVSGIPRWKNVGDTLFTVWIRDRWGSSAACSTRLTVLPTVYSPGTFALVSPGARDSIRLASLDTSLVFSWSAARDEDVQDTVRYKLWLGSSEGDTTVTLSDTALSLPVRRWFKPGLHYRWTVTASDGNAEVKARSPHAFVILYSPHVPDTLVAVEVPEENNAATYPNPFNPSTKVRLSLLQESHVTIDVYNVIGQRIKGLADERFSKGSHTIDWTPGAVASGVYFIRIVATDPELERVIYRNTLRCLFLR